MKHSAGTGSESREASIDRRRQQAVVGCAIALAFSPISHAFGTGTTIAARAAETPTALTPAGATFFICFALLPPLVGYAVAQADVRRRDCDADRTTGWAAALAFLANAAWFIEVSQAGFTPLSLMLALAAQIASTVAAVGVARSTLTSARLHLVLAVPLTFHGGWMLGILILNVAATLTALGVGVSVGIDVLCAAVVIVASAAALLVIVVQRGLPLYAIGYSLFLLGVLLAEFRREQPLTIISTGTAILAVMLASVISWRRRRSEPTVS